MLAVFEFGDHFVVHLFVDVEVVTVPYERRVEFVFRDAVAFEHAAAQVESRRVGFVGVSVDFDNSISHLHISQQVSHIALPDYSVGRLAARCGEEQQSGCYECRKMFHCFSVSFLSDLAQ